MNELLRDDLVYVISTEEILWGGVLLADHHRHPRPRDAASRCA